ncbi:Transposable element P transposase [Frankliniella fusca]|uniref:Transposable element P transposase n=1 Tax=Frankliniella fusca TaxID=407009 RepID=A0AAE1HRL9_9NEOP|nr:Transposable element P transposase [Frankliniella fusca]
MGGSSCSVFGCKSTSLKNKDLSFIRIPKTRAEKWRVLLGNDALRDLTIDQLYKRRVCAKHFEDSDFKNVRRDSVNWNVDPSLHLPAPLTPLLEEQCVDDPPPTVQMAPADKEAFTVLNEPPHIQGAAVESMNMDVEQISVEASETVAIDQVPTHGSNIAEDINNNFNKIIQSSTILIDHSYTEHSAVMLDEQHIPPDGPSSRKQVLASVPRVQPVHQTPLVSTLLHTARNTRSSLLDLKRRYLKKCQEMKVLKRNQEENALLVLKNKISPSLFKILKCQIRNYNRKPRGRRYTQDEKVVFLGMHQNGPKAYRSSPWIKPTQQTVRTALQELGLKPGINPILISALKTRADGMQEEKKEVLLVFDETAAKVNFVYCQKTDEIKGYSDLGDGVKRALPGEELMVAMVRCIFGNWKQPLAFFYTNKKLNASDFKKIFTDCITAVLSTGLRVRSMVTDGLTKNGAAVKALGATLESPYFFINDRKIYALSDVPHLLKSLRNALMLYWLRLKDGTLVKKEYIDEFVRLDMQMTPRLVKNITETHLNPNTFQKMSVPLAAQLLNRKIAAGIMVYSLFSLPQEATYTAKFCERIHNFFDSWNGIVVDDENTETYKKAFTDNSGHLKLWEEMYEEIKHWTFIGSTNLQFPRNFLIAMQAVSQLYFDLKSEGYEFLPVGHINQDCLENFFSVLRALGGHRHTIALNEVPSLFASALIRNLTTSVKGKNCRDDNALNLVHLQALLDAARAAKEQRAKEISEAEPEDTTFYFFEPPTPVVEETEGVEEEEMEEDVEEEGLLGEENAVTPNPILTTQEFCDKVLQGMGSINSASVAAPLIRKHSTAINCSECSKLLLTSPEFPLHALHTFGSTANTFNQLQPSKNITKCVEDIYRSAFETVPKISHTSGVMASFQDVVKSLPSVRAFQLCPHHEDRREAIVRDISCAALNDVVLSINQTYKMKKQQKKSRKYQVVSHQ